MNLISTVFEVVVTGLMEIAPDFFIPDKSVLPAENTNPLSILAPAEEDDEAPNG